MRTTSRLTRWLSAVATLLMAASLTAPLAHAAPDVEEAEQKVEEAEQRVEQLGSRAEQAEQRADSLAGSVESAQQRRRAAAAEVERLQGELQEASQQLQAARQRADDAQAAADQAREESQQAQAELEASEAELQDNQDQLSAFARDSYKYGTQNAEPMLAALRSVASAEDPTDLANSLHILELSLGDRSELVTESRRLVAQTAELRDEAKQARQRAEARLAEAVEAREETAGVHARMMQLVAEADAALQARRQAVSDLQARRADMQQTAERLEDRKAAAQDQVERAREAFEEAQRRSRDVTVTPIPGGLVTVGGITVAASLAPRLRALLEDARSDGLLLTGYGYRSRETTIYLRKVNGCPDVYESPPSACDVPTARPGESMHERGLAVDFNYQGSTICFPYPPSECHGNPAFDWLQANAHRYGLYGLSTEAWHWSTNGR